MEQDTIMHMSFRTRAWRENVILQKLERAESQIVEAIATEAEDNRKFYLKISLDIIRAQITDIKVNELMA